ncbi:MAG TPA: CheR family methyltransferase [Kofleriaceae bacterium]|nr:CheR family methyltransferase [Kofleriaceae bacterium]
MKELTVLIERFERWTGLDLQRGSSHAALERYLKLKLPADDPAALARFVDDVTTPHHPEAVQLVDAITVCHSSFYRDPEQLAAVTAVLRTEPSRPGAVWIPACATGEDAYSIALIAESLGRQVSILATDINTRALAHATAGVYGPWSVRELPPSMALPRREDGRYEIPERLRRPITFARHNLMDSTPNTPGGWDVIVCRNVLMYISRERALDVIQRLGAALRPGGYLFVGANDILARAPAPLRFVRFGPRHVLWRPPTQTATGQVPPPPAGTLVTSLSTGTTNPPPNSSSAPLAAGSIPPVLSSSAGLPSGTIPPATTSSTPVPGSISSGMARRTPTAPPPMGAGASSGASSGVSPGTSSGVPAATSAMLTPPAGVAAPGAAAQAASRRAGAGPIPARAHALLLDGDTPGALELVLALLEDDPLCVEARLIAGIAYQLSGDALQATAALRAALVLAPDLWPAEMYLGFALLQLGDEQNARRALRRGSQLAEMAERLPLSPSVASWFEAWRTDVIQMGREAWARARSNPG